MARQQVSIVRIASVPASGTVRCHCVATNVPVINTKVLVVVVLIEVDESILLVVRVGHGRAGMGVGDVVATIVITTVHSVKTVLGHLVVLVLILGLVNGTTLRLVMTEVELV